MTKNAHDIASALLIAVAVALLAGPAAAEDSAPEPYRNVPPPNDRLYERTDGDVRVTTAVPSAKEAQEIFGVKLYSNNIQPVWIQIENLGSTTLFFLPIGLDAGLLHPGGIRGTQLASAICCGTGHWIAACPIAAWPSRFAAAIHAPDTFSAG